MGGGMGRRMVWTARALVAVVMVLVMVMVSVATSGAPAAAVTPTVTFSLLSPLPSELAVGETAVIGVHVESSEPLVMAIALSDAYYPGRGVRFDGSAAATGSTSADLFLTVTGRDSTADLGPVENWPEDQDWPAGVAPLAVRAGARFAGGYVASSSWLFAVAVS